MAALPRNLNFPLHWSVRILFTRCPVFQSGELQVRAAVSPHRRQDDHLQEVRPRHGHGPRGGQGMGTQVKQIVRMFRIEYK